MKQYRIMMIAVLLAMAGRTLADDMTIETITLEPGETKQVAICLNNSEKTYTAFQLNLELPEGVTIAKNDDKYIAALDEDRKGDHSLKVSKKSEGVYRLMAFSLSNTVFSGTDGPLVYVTLQADASAVNGSKKGTLSEQVLTEESGDQNYLDDVSFNIIMSSTLSLMGDVTNDGQLTAADVTALARYIIGRNPSPFNVAAADVNGDTKIDIADVVKLITLF